MEQGFVSKKDYRFPNLDELFLGKDECVYFIEDEVTHEWICKNYFPIFKWTKDPNLAMAFESDMKARTFAVENKLSGWVITEHKFI